MGFWKNLAMEVEDRGYDLIEGAICVEHIRDRALRASITEWTADAECVVCGRAGDKAQEPFAVELDELMKPVVEAINFLFAPASSLPWDSEDQVYVGPVREEYDVLESSCFNAFEDAAYDVVIPLMAAALSGRDAWTPFGAPAETEDLQYGWDSFAETVKHFSRFVYAGDEDEDREAPGASILDFLEQLRVYVDGDLGLVRTLEEGTVVYRGRLVERRGDIPPTASKLGPAPAASASANRMSAAGIPLMYASQDPQTAVAEIAAHGHKPRALIGGFRSTRPLRVLDLTGTPNVPSVFDLRSRHAYVMARFLRDFVRAVTTPVIPDGREHIEYVPTQVITEYLRWVPSTRLDGIALPSSQSRDGAKTYVFFVGPEGVGDAGVEPLTTAASLFNRTPTPPVFTLDARDVRLWDVVRSYEARPSSAWA